MPLNIVIGRKRFRRSLRDRERSLRQRSVAKKRGHRTEARFQKGQAKAEARSIREADDRVRERRRAEERRKGPRRRGR